jgi:murein DD-endopeptidase MepM/ murein hydrolase activator NlpD
MPTNTLAAAAALVLAPTTALAAVQTARPEPSPARSPDRTLEAAAAGSQTSLTLETSTPERHPDRWRATPPMVLGTSTSARPTDWIWPLSPRPPVLRRFDVGPYRWSPGHRGVDLAARPAAPVVAPAAGVVTFARTVVGRPVIVITHAGGVRTAYEPALAGVPRGAAVPRGAVVGTVTADPGHCGSRTCVHWSARRGDRYIDPLSLLTPTRVVLLPMSPAPPIDDG